MKICDYKKENSKSKPDLKPILSERKHQRPVRVAAVRARERMLIWASNLNEEHIDWLNVDELEDTQVTDAITTSDDRLDDNIPIVEIEEYMAPVWEDES